MFGFRSDGKKVKGMNIIDKAEPYFMPMRIDAVNYINVKIPCDKLDEFIRRERANGNSFTYMHLVFATIVRVLYTRPKLNRFIMRGVVYQRNGITISLDVKKELTDDGESLTLKFPFTGRENIYEVKEIVDRIIKENLEKGEDATTKFIKHLTWTPSWVLRWALALFRFMDRHGMLTKGMINASPFHTSCFLTNLKSIKLKYVYHHLYNFGTTSMFISMGKEKMEPVVIDNKELSIAKIMNLGISLDERVADGLYMGKTLRLLEDIMANLDVLKEHLPEDGTIPKNLTKVKKVKKQKKSQKNKKLRKNKKIKKNKEEKPKKIKPLKNKEKHESRQRKTKEK